MLSVGDRLFLARLQRLCLLYILAFFLQGFDELFVPGLAPSRVECLVVMKLGGRT